MASGNLLLSSSILFSGNTFNQVKEMMDIASVASVKWLSILYHITNRHMWKGCKYFFKCVHAKLSKKEQRKKPWLKLTESSFNQLKVIIASKRLIKDLKYLCDFNHTDTLEIYHSLYNKY